MVLIENQEIRDHIDLQYFTCNVINHSEKEIQELKPQNIDLVIKRINEPKLSNQRYNKKHRS